MSLVRVMDATNLRPKYPRWKPILELKVRTRRLLAKLTVASWSQHGKDDTLCRSVATKCQLHLLAMATSHASLNAAAAGWRSACDSLS
jgi:hypothetical protein